MFTEPMLLSWLPARITMNHSTRDKTLTEEQDKIENDLFVSLLPTIKKIARSRKRQQLNITLQTTEIIHETYIRVINETSDKWDNPRDFLMAFSESMRYFLIDYYRKKKAQKRGGQHQFISMDGVEINVPAMDEIDNWQGLDQKLELLKQIDPMAFEVIMLRYFSGLTAKETAKLLKTDRKTITRKWQFARSWLNSRLQLNKEGDLA